MPVYEFLCAKCGARAETFSRSVHAEVTPPACPGAGDEPDHRMKRTVSGFARKLTTADQLAEAEAKFGKQVDDVMGPGPDIGRFARRYERLSKDLPPPENPVVG